ncbi:MAG: cytochrome c oxidase subunit II [Verrucomicrobia bacterium]|nr:cytochrome c oxidase subunit II [Verrucomicrobiota bacterium]
METLVTKLLHLPPVASAHGTDLDNLMLYVHVLMGVLFVGWSVFFGYAIWRFRKSRSPKADHAGVRSHVSSYLEVAVAVIEAVLLVGFAVPLWARSASATNFPAEADATVVRVIGRQFNWMARYAGPDGVFGLADAKHLSGANPLGIDPDDANAKDDIVTENSEIYVPVGKPVIAHISSLDVIHSFAVRQMRITQDAIPGLSIPVWFTPTQVGVYQITCAQLCGNGHSNMRGLLRVVTQPEYDAWLRSKSKTAAEPVSYD